MGESLDVVAGWCWRGLGCLGVAVLIFGVFSAAAPARSIALYAWIMARCNWRVSPIDAPRELRTTRWLGILLAALSSVILWRVSATGR